MMAVVAAQMLCTEFDIFCSGDANVDEKRDIFCIDDPAQGAALYRMQPPAQVRTYPVPVTKTKHARSVSFAEESAFIVIGSDHSVIYVFNKQTGEVVDMLQVGSLGWVQTITVSTCKFNVLSCTSPGTDSRHCWSVFHPCCTDQQK
jgi:hypothetical protein